MSHIIPSAIHVCTKSAWSYKQIALTPVMTHPPPTHPPPLAGLTRWAKRWAERGLDKGSGQHLFSLESIKLVRRVIRAAALWMLSGRWLR
jgi:hypothetical protein